MVNALHTCDHDTADGCKMHTKHKPYTMPALELAGGVQNGIFKHGRYNKVGTNKENVFKLKKQRHVFTIQKSGIFSTTLILIIFKTLYLEVSASVMKLQTNENMYEILQLAQGVYVLDYFSCLPCLLAPAGLYCIPRASQMILHFRFDMHSSDPLEGKRICKKTEALKSMPLVPFMEPYELNQVRANTSALSITCA